MGLFSLKRNEENVKKKDKKKKKQLTDGTMTLTVDFLVFGWRLATAIAETYLS